MCPHVAAPSPLMPYLGAPTEAGGYTPLAAMPICGPACRCSQGLSCLQALEVLTSSVEYGLQDLCKVRPCLDLEGVVPKCPCAEKHPKMVPVWLVAGGGSEDGTEVHHSGPMQA